MSALMTMTWFGERGIFSSAQLNQRFAVNDFSVPYCPSFIADCGHTQPGGKIESITNRILDRMGASKSVKADEAGGVSGQKRAEGAGRPVRGEPGAATAQERMKRKKVTFHCSVN